MKKILSKESLYGLFVIAALWSCQKPVDTAPVTTDQLSKKTVPRGIKEFEQVNLVGDNDQYKPAHIDPTLINAWGISLSGTGPVWVTSQGGTVSEIYNGNGNTLRPSVTIPSLNASVGGHPTGIVLNNTPDFKLPNGNPARFIFAEAEGLLSGWNGGNAAIKTADVAFGNFYFGLTMASVDGQNFLYAANFSQNRIDVYDKNWAKVNMPFIDPDLKKDFSPFNIQSIDGKLYVMYAKHGTKDGEIVSTSPGSGFVDIFNSDGSYLKRLVSGGQLNAPWGITKAPAGFFGEGANMKEVVLIGNFGDGHINAYTGNGILMGNLQSHGAPIEIERLWAIGFAPATSSIDHNALYFAAGPGGEQHGLFGFIKKRM